MQIKSQTSKKPVEFKNPAIAFDLQGKGAISVTPKGLIWKAGKTQNAKNVTVKWDAFANWMQSQLPGAPKAKKAPAKTATAKTAARSKTAKGGKVLKIAAARNGIKKATARSAASARKVAHKKAH